MELAVRRRLHALGYRYRVNHRMLPEQRFRGDIVWPRQRLVVYLDGCFWHGCPVHGNLPKSNREWWAAKLEANRERDSRATQLLVDGGWTVLRFWEHDPVEDVVANIRAQLARPSGM